MKMGVVTLPVKYDIVVGNSRPLPFHTDIVLCADTALGNLMDRGAWGYTTRANSPKSNCGAIPPLEQRVGTFSIDMTHVEVLIAATRMKSVKLVLLNVPRTYAI